jgi:hypothetical protein
MFSRVPGFSTCIVLLVALGALSAAEKRADSRTPNHARVVVAPTKTSIYVGSVSMTTATFGRVNGGYETTYVAKVFPYFFYNENGRLRIEISDESLSKLAGGEAINFQGRAVRDDGAERRVEGRATPTDAMSGKIKVRVFYSKRIELIFNTTYRFPDEQESRKP